MHENGERDALFYSLLQSSLDEKVSSDSSSDYILAHQELKRVSKSEKCSDDLSKFTPSPIMMLHA